MDTIEERLPPNSAEAEEAVLGSLVIDPDAIVEVLGILKPADFYHAGNRHVFQAIVRLFERREPVDLVTLINELRSAGVLEAVGGEYALINLMNAVPTSINASYYADIVADKARRRDVFAAASRMVRIAYAEDSNLDSVQRLLVETAASMRGPQEDKGVAEAATAASEYLDMLHDAESGVMRATVPLCFPPLAPMFEAGVWRGQLMSIFARPSIGKTVVAMNIAMRQAIELWRDAREAGLAPEGQILIFSLEMKRRELVHRMVQSLLGVPFSMVRYAKGNLTVSAAEQASLANSWLAKVIGREPRSFEEAVMAASGLISELPIVFIDRAQMSVADIWAESLRQSMFSRIDAVYIDHVLLTDDAVGAENNASATMSMFARIKNMAADLDTLVVALSQASRNVETRDDCVLRRSDMYMGGEQSSNIIIGVEVPLGPDKKPAYPFGTMTLRVLKNRDGPTGAARVHYDYRPFYISPDPYEETGQGGNGFYQQSGMAIV